MLHRVLIALTLLIAICFTACAAEITSDFSAPLQSPWLRLIGDSQVANGVLTSAAQNNWQRSGLQIGPLPAANGTWQIDFDFRPVVLGDQCQEFVSESPSSHFYMCYVNPRGGMTLHTNDADGWQARKNTPGPIQAGTWYHETVRLTSRSIRITVRTRDDNKELWDTGAVPMGDLGPETTCALVDEAATTGGKTEWDNLSVSTDDKTLAAKMKTLAAQLEARRKEQTRREAAARQLRASGIALIPMPQDVQLLSYAPFTLRPGLKITGASASARTAVASVLEERLGLKTASADKGAATITLRALEASSAVGRHSQQAYTLQADKSGIVIAARTTEGFFYAAQTLCQLASEGRKVPAVRIADWPAIESRLCMVAVSQGAFQVIDVDYWKRLIRELAAVKINYIQPYFEGGTMYYEKYPFLGLKGRDGFTIAKGRILSEYAKQHCIEIVPQQESLGHSGNTLGHEELKDLRESGDVFCSSNPKTFQFLGDLYDELCQAFPYAKWIHVGGDEFAQGFAKCPLCKKRADEIGKPGLYAEHIMKLREMLKARGRGIQIWWHEEGYTDQAADRLAKDIVVFDWHYGNQASYPTLAKLQGEGFAQTWATPAVTRYYSDPNDWDNTFGNISGFMKAAAERKIPGECTCTWVHGIWGGRNLFELNLYGLAFSGACAWNPYVSDYAGFRGDFGREWFGLTSSTQQAGDRAPADPVELLIRDTIHYPYGEPKEQKFWANHAAAEEILAAPLRSTAEEITRRPDIVDEAHQLLAFCQRATQALDTIQRSATRNKVSAEFFAHDVHIHETLARRIILTKSLMDAWEQAKTLKGKAREDLLTGQIGELRGLVEHYRQIEAMFDRSIKEAGGGRCGTGGWWPFVASGGVQFRAPQGRAEVEKEIDYLNKSLTLEDLPQSAWPG